MFRFLNVALAAAAIVCAAVAVSLAALQPDEETPAPVLSSARSSDREASVSAKAIPTPAPGTWGVVASGVGGGAIFRDADSDAEARLGTQATGVNGYGSASGGYFQSSVDSGWARLGWGDVGIGTVGDLTGAVFAHSSGDPFAWAAYTRDAGTDILGNDNSGEYGIFAGGLSAGGYFEHTMDSSMVYLATGSNGVEGWGVNAGGIFRNTDLSSGVILGIADTGIEARGDGAGGYFQDTESSGADAFVASGTAKIEGNGSVNFVQNHPFDPDSVIVYSAPEGAEVATYTRGTARLEGGEARVPLEETFRWVTNPDIGLTAHLTARGEPVPLAVVGLSTDEMVVRASADAPDGTVFDYLVIGLRIGFEESTGVREKQREAYIPSMADHRVLAARRPDLARHTALARWTTERKALGLEEPVDLTRAHALRDAIQEYDQAVHGQASSSRAVVPSAATDRAAGSDRTRPVRREEALAARRGGEAAVRDASSEGVVQPEHELDVHARSFHPSAGELASQFAVSEPVQPGDVLVIDTERPGMLRRAASPSDPTVVGVVADSPGVLLGSADSGAQPSRAAVALSGVASCKVDASFGPVYPGDLLVTSPNPGHAMRGDAPLPGTVVGKALEEATSGTGTIRVLVMLR
jgi:hypothetical protein